MQFTQWALLLLLLSWSLQIAGSWIQWRHYRDAMSDATSRWTNGFVGVGRSKGRLFGGAMALLAVDPELRVRQLRTMRGLSVFARFHPEPAVSGWTLGELAALHSADTALGRAVRQSIVQIEEVRRRQS